VKDWVGDKAKSDRRSSIIGVVVGVPLTGEVFGILTTVIFAFKAQGDQFPGSLINPFFLLSFAMFVSCAVLRRNSRILKACKMTTTTVTLVRTHKDFRAALSNR
jgi:hypothetical protein